MIDTIIKKGEVFNTVKNYPQIYQIELTEKCNFNCPMCINDLIIDKKNMKKETIDLIVDSGYLLNTLYTELQFSGEPTLSPHLEYAIDKIHSVGTMVGLSTNLSTIQTPGMVEIINKLDQLTISLDVFDKEKYEESRHPSKFYDFTNNLEFALDNLNNPLIQIQLLRTEWTGSVYDESKEELEQWLLDRYSFDGELPDWLIIREVEDCFVNYHDNGEKKSNDQMCLNPFTTVSIKADGTIVPCCFDFLKDIPLGNIHKDDLLDVWQGKLSEYPTFDECSLAYLREDHQSQGVSLPHKCQECYARSPITFMNNEIVPSLVRFKLNQKG